MQLAFVLVEPKVPENVGAAARALKTMGFGQLWLVNSEAHRHERAHWLAHGSDDILDQARTFADLAEVRAAAQMLIGTSAKPRHGKRDLHPPAQLRELLDNKGTTLAQAALVFGREDRGLSNDELALCDLVSGIPLACAYPSLNLGQAVMLYAYELARLASVTSTPEEAAPASWQALQQRLQALLPVLTSDQGEKLRQWLFERLPLLAEKDIGFCHSLCHNLEQHLQQQAPLVPPTGSGKKHRS